METPKISRSKLTNVFVLILTLIGLIFSIYKFRQWESIERNNNYAGIEIGSTGPRLVIIELFKKKNEIGFKYLSPPISENAPNKVIEGTRTFKVTKTEELIRICRSFLDTIKQSKYQIPDSHIYIAFGSKFKNTINKLEVEEEFRKEFPKTSIEFLSPTLEGQSDFYTIETSFLRREILGVDIGSSTINFTGFGGESNLTFTRAIPNGPKTIVEIIENQNSINTLDVQRHKNIIDRFLKDKIFPEIQSVISNNPILFQTKNVMIFTGGTAYRIICALDQQEDELPNIDNNMLDQFSTMLLSNHPEIFKNDPNNARFTLTELYIGQQIIKNIMQFSPRNTSKFFYARKSWIPGYMLYKRGNL